MNETADFQHSRVEHLEPAKLARLLAADAAADSWNGEDPAVILGHQLRAPLLPDLLMVPGTEEARLRALVHGRPGAGSFVDQLTFVHPSLELLQAIKDFARHVCGDADNPLHGSPANVLYFAAIAAAIARCDARISRLPDHELREGFSWALQQPAAGPLAAVLLAGLEKLLTTDH